jgi:Xaa-Pro aminopeptidase
VTSGIPPRFNRLSCYLLAEPGYYADGKFGIRIENITVVRKAETPNNFGDKGYLGMEVRSALWEGWNIPVTESLAPSP